MLTPLGGFPAREVIEQVAAVVDRFAESAPQADDMTLLALTWAP